VAGVQNASRQQSSFVPLRQTMLSTFRQLSTVLACANAAIGVTSAAVANSAATLLSFFMILLSRNAAVACVTSKTGRDVRANTCSRTYLPSTKSLCHIASSGQHFGGLSAFADRPCCVIATSA
jgi:hypothetical protein